MTDALTHLPLQGAAVTAGDAVTRTDSEGRYALSISPSTGLQVTARRTGYFVPAALSAPINIATGETLRRDFKLRPLLKISGAVEDYDTGERLPGCHVFALRRIYALGQA